MTNNRAFWKILLPLLATVLPLTTATIGKAENTPWDIVPCNLAPTVFRHDNFRGRLWPLQVSIRNLKRLSMGDEISSLCVPKGWAIIAYEHDSFGGDKLEVTGPDFWTDLKRNRPYGKPWGDRISSIAVFKWVDGRWQRMPTY